MTLYEPALTTIVGQLESEAIYWSFRGQILVAYKLFDGKVGAMKGALAALLTLNVSKCRKIFFIMLQYAFYLKTII